ncbi:hypothetical protein BDA99DRAFT_554767 [Phascolomyces articulosus]|uniref:F-box domain-containing protein n=1 Tax=Phascolomyces articulosus TaxID=60185 RepID=A0AAD5PL55_9FUNG|nr:hypothetical protein BDA99DRAFT_554767 [Phascolomyces articulosus]
MIYVSQTQKFKIAYGTTRKTLLSVVPNKQKKSSPSSTSIQQNFSAPVVTNTKKRKAKKKEAQKTIAGSPELAKGYFALAQLYREQDDFHTATNIYLQGLESVPSDDPDYTLLLKEKEKVRTKIKQRSEDGFYHLLPYDILCLIFDDLEYKDLLQCTTVCQRWNNFMVEWPEFWNRVLLGMPNVDRSTLVSFIQGRARELRLNGSLDRGVNQDILWLLYCMENNNFIQKLCK